MVDQTATHSANVVLSTDTLRYARPHYNLPQPLTSFVGRAAEQATVQQLLTTERLVTLTGAGGCGKTRLALEIVHRLVDAEHSPCPDGMGWVELAPLADPTLVIQVLLSAFGLHEQPDSDPWQMVINAFAPKALLVVLDNCEHLAAACATLAETLLHTCPRVRILTTSREPLGVAGETVWATPSLVLAEAVALFRARAAAISPAFLAAAKQEAIAQLCQQVEGLPLAIELAAARLRVLSVEQICARLADALAFLASDSRILPARQRTLQSTLDWSYALLTPEEQQCLPRLAVFAGSFTLEAVEAVCSGNGIAANTLLELILQLANKSLLVVEEQADAARYRYLEPVRQYAVQKLQERGEETHWRRQQVAWCVVLAEQSERAIETRDQLRWLQCLELELANLRAAFDWCQQDDSCRVLALQLAVTLQPFWNKQNRRSEGRRWLDQFNTVHETLPLALRARAFFCNGQLAYNQLDATAAIAYYRAGIALCRTAPLPQQQAQAWAGIGHTHLLLGEQEAAAAAYQESLTAAEASNVAAEVIMALRGLGLTAQSRQDYGQARTYYETALACAQTNADHFLVGYLLENLGYLCLTQDDYSTARSYYLACLALVQQKGGADREAQALICLAAVALKEGNTAQAQQLYGESLVLLRAVRKPQRMVAVLNCLAALVRQQGALPAAQSYYTEALAQREGVRKTDVIVTLAGLGDLALAAGARSQARDHYSEALALALTLSGSAPANFDPAMPMVLSPSLSAQAWVAALQEKLTYLLLLSTNDQAGVPTPLEEMLKPEQHAGVVANPQFAPVQGKVSMKPTDRAGLQVYALGPLRVCLAGRELTAADWVYARAKEVLLYLLIHPSATREQIALEFWPDASPEEVRSRFSAVLTHARKALGRDFDWIPFADGRYTFNRMGAYWFDVELFESQVKAAHQYLRQRPPQVAAAISCLEKAIALYQGDFVADLREGPWLENKREALRQAFADALLTLGRLYVEADQIEQAADIYRRALAHDRYLEEAHRELMRCLARQGEPALALRQYKSLASILDELDATPSPETEGLVERLRRGERV